MSSLVWFERLSAELNSVTTQQLPSDSRGSCCFLKFLVPALTEWTTHSIPVFQPGDGRNWTSRGIALQGHQAAVLDPLLSGNPQDPSRSCKTRVGTRASREHTAQTHTNRVANLPWTWMLTSLEKAIPKLFRATHRYWPASSFWMLWIFRAP